MGDDLFFTLYIDLIIHHLLLRRKYRVKDFGMKISLIITTRVMVEKADFGSLYLPTGND